jgi:NAD(P)-dependent dehydrogenase (short-subunit alcohol dehydrogenase family)
LLSLGGTSGIGLATAKAALALGADVVVTGRHEGKLRSVLDELGEGVTATHVDATAWQELDAFFADLGQVDDLVLAVGEAAGAGPIVELDLADLRAGFEGKFWPQIASLQAALPVMQSHGSLTFISAASAGSPVPGAAGFAAINGALEAMVPALAVEQTILITGATDGHGRALAAELAAAHATVLVHGRDDTPSA